jgi:hypothetical protein
VWGGGAEAKVQEISIIGAPKISLYSLMQSCGPSPPHPDLHEGTPQDDLVVVQ